MDGIVSDMLLAAVALFGTLTIIGVFGFITMRDERRSHR